MKRTYNYTGRTRIEQRDVSLRLLEVSNGSMRVRVNTDLLKYDFSSNAKVRLEAYSDTLFDQWQLEDALLPYSEHEVSLHDFTDTSGIRFRIKVSDPATSRLLAHTSIIRLTDSDDIIGDSEGLLPVRLGDIGNLLWKLDFDDIEGNPELLLSNRLRGQERGLASDPMFRACVLPEMLRRILEKGLIEDEASTEDSDSSWFGQWIEWMDSVPALRGHVDSLLNQYDTDAKRSEINDVVDEFAGLRENSFLNKVVTGANWDDA